MKIELNYSGIKAESSAFLQDHILFGCFSELQ